MVQKELNRGRHAFKLKLNTVDFPFSSSFFLFLIFPPPFFSILANQINVQPSVIVFKLTNGKKVKSCPERRSHLYSVRLIQSSGLLGFKAKSILAKRPIRIICHRIPSTKCGLPAIISSAPKIICV